MKQQIPKIDPRVKARRLPDGGFLITWRPSVVLGDVGRWLVADAVHRRGLLVDGLGFDAVEVRGSCPEELFNQVLRIVVAMLEPYSEPGTFINAEAA